MEFENLNKTLNDPKLQQILNPGDTVLGEPIQFDICPKAHGNKIVPYRGSCKEAQNPDTFNKFCNGNYQSCPRNNNQK